VRYIRLFGLVLVTLLVVLVLSALGACTYVDKARDFSGEQVARAVEVECALSWPERRKNLAAVNRGLAARGLDSRATALDCNGDGEPDF
jgi:hypothetical protein